MSNGNHGLRFDIYERVHLPENVAAIDELEEIELVPRIQVIDQGEHAVLQGQLVLNGIYRAQGEADEQVALEHWIPVEITLPMNRVTRLDEVTVDIDTFDVVLLSSRALNLTGILSLRGIVLEQEQESDGWSAEVFTASHSREDEEESIYSLADYRNEQEQQAEDQAYQYAQYEHNGQLQFVEQQEQPAGYGEVRYEAGEYEQQTEFVAAAYRAEEGYEQQGSNYEAQYRTENEYGQPLYDQQAAYAEGHYQAAEQAEEQYEQQAQQLAYADGQYRADEQYDEQAYSSADGSEEQQPSHYSYLQQLERKYEQAAFNSQYEHEEVGYSYRAEGQDAAEQLEQQEQAYQEAYADSYAQYAAEQVAEAESSEVSERINYLNESSAYNEAAWQQEQSEQERDDSLAQAQPEQQQAEQYEAALQSSSSYGEEQWSDWETVEAQAARQPQSEADADSAASPSGQYDEQLQEQLQEVEQASQPPAEPPIERELHIALNGNKAQNEAQGLRTILNSSLREQAAQQAATLQQQELERQRDEQEKQRVIDDDIEWQQLFLSKRPEQNEFKRIRMCIVQKEDTLEQIASRYSVNPRELLLRNNLHESAITEGQLLYIP